MPLAIGIAIVQQLTFFSLLFENSFFTKPASMDTRSLMFAVALFSTFLSVPSFIWNVIMVRSSRSRKDVISAVLSVATFAFGIGYLVFAFVQRTHDVGLTLF